ncbi:MAG TPA: glycosyl transferase, partial [bacterium]
RRYGHGLLPDSFHAFCAQRDRWVAGAMQIIRKHWRLMLPRRRQLTSVQKYHFVTGWAFWISDALGVLAAVLNLLWVPMILFVGVLVPAVPFTVPILAMFGVNLMHCALLYTLRVRIPPSHVVGAALASMSLQLTVARAVAKGLFKGRLTFLRTEKGGLAKLLAAPGPRRGVLGAEGWIGLALAASAAAIWLSNERGSVELNLFAATMAVQCLPFLSAPAMVLLERYTRPKSRPKSQTTSAPVPQTS